MSVAGVILAAGASRRLGEPKQLALVGGERLLDRAVRTMGEAGCSPVVVVLGAEAEAVQTGCHVEAVTVVMNPNWAEGMGASIRVGVAAAMPLTNGVVVMTCDQPAVTAAHLLRLIASGETTASSYAGRCGVPAYFPSSALETLQNLAGDTGARGLLADAQAVPLPGGELDVDTPATLAAARQLYG